MARKSELKTLGTTHQVIVANPAELDSLILSNKSQDSASASVRIRRGQNIHTIFNGLVPPGRSVFAFGGKDKGISVDGSDLLEASSSAPNAVDAVCSYRETAGSQPLFNISSWNDRQSWASSRGLVAGTFDPPQIILDGLNSGASRWRSSCCYERTVYDAISSMVSGWSGLEMENYSEINAENGYLASCGVNLYAQDGDLLNAVSFDIQVNLFYADQISPEEWGDVITHELGHALGIGIFWNAESFFLSGSSYPETQSSYNLITSLERNKTPLESLGGSGTASAHWENNFRTSDSVSYYGVTDEIMVGALIQGGMILSDMSLGALKDFGYETYPSIEGVPHLATSTAIMKMDGLLKCGLCRKNHEKMMGMMKPKAIAQKGKLTLRRYIVS